MKVVKFLLVSMLALFTPVLGENHFDNFIQKYNKQYHTEDEYNKRLEIFSQNVNFIQNHNSRHSSFTLDINEFADLTHQEFKNKMLTKPLLKEKNICWTIQQDKDECFAHSNEGCHWCSLGGMYGTFCAPAGSHNCFASTISNTTVPTSLDWRTSSGNPKGIVAVTGVKNQEQCGSCWSFSASGATEGAWAISGKSLTSLSEQQLVDCSSSYGNNGCGGGDMDAAFQYIIKNGLCTEASYPYKAVDEKCKTCSPVAHLDGYIDISDEAGILTQIQNGPVSVGIEADQAVFQFYSGGVLDDPSCGTNLDHGVLAVGYGNMNGKDYWIVKNSWGASWGMNGYVLIARGKDMCGISQMASRPYYLNKLGFDWSLLWECVDHCGGSVIKDIIQCAGDLAHIWDILKCVGDIVGTVSPCYKCVKGILG
jgi:C1A family cysteine protease